MPGCAYGLGDPARFGRGHSQIILRMGRGAYKDAWVHQSVAVALVSQSPGAGIDGENHRGLTWRLGAWGQMESRNVAKSEDETQETVTLAVLTPTERRRTAVVVAGNNVALAHHARTVVVTGADANARLSRVF